MPNLGQLIKEHREAAELSQKKLSNACGMSDSTISKIEDGSRPTPQWDTLCKIAKALDFHPFEILLEAGYITKKDIHPNTLIHGLEALDDAEIATVQLFIDFVKMRKDTDAIVKEGQ